MLFILNRLLKKNLAWYFFLSSKNRAFLKEKINISLINNGNNCFLLACKSPPIPFNGLLSCKDASQLTCQLEQCNTGYLNTLSVTQTHTCDQSSGQWVPPFPSNFTNVCSSKSFSFNGNTIIALTNLCTGKLHVILMRYFWTWNVK